MGTVKSVRTVIYKRSMRYMHIATPHNRSVQGITHACMCCLKSMQQVLQLDITQLVHVSYIGEPLGRCSLCARVPWQLTPRSGCATEITLQNIQRADRVKLVKQFRINQ